MRGLPNSPIQGHVEQPCGFEPCEPSPVLSENILTKLIYMIDLFNANFNSISDVS